MLALVIGANNGVCCPVGCNNCTTFGACIKCWGNSPPNTEDPYFKDGTLCTKTCPVKFYPDN